MPVERTKKRKTPESVPDINDPDRKRVLNVLAQRRYRQRCREKVAALEAQTKCIPSHPITLPCHERVETDISVDPAGNATHGQLVPLGQVITTIDEDYASLLQFDQDAFDIQNFSNLSSPTSPIPSSSKSLMVNFPLLPDGAVFSMPIFATVRALASVAVALDVVSHLWDPSYLHVLPQSIPALSELPPNLHPVPAQLTIPHHPVIDLLPWPSVRDKLICMLSMPSAFRPPAAREDDAAAFSPLATLDEDSSTSTGVPTKQSGAIIQLMLDIDDPRDDGGVRVHGNLTSWGQGNEFVEEAWEVGGSFYRRWWWCFDQRIVDMSNRRRRERGLERLRVMV